MLYLTCTTITSVDLAHYGVSRAKDLVFVDCGTIDKTSRFFKATYICNGEKNNTCIPQVKRCLGTVIVYAHGPWA